jgi:hypothetical protein
MPRSRKLCRQKKAETGEIGFEDYWDDEYDEDLPLGTASSGRSAQGGLTAGHKEDNAALDAATESQLRKDGMLAFERYYRKQNIFEDNCGQYQASWPRFMMSLRQPLPITFRIAKTG